MKQIDDTGLGTMGYVCVCMYVYVCRCLRDNERERERERERGMKRDRGGRETLTESRTYE